MRSLLACRPGSGGCLLLPTVQRNIFQNSIRSKPSRSTPTCNHLAFGCGTRVALYSPGAVTNFQVDHRTRSGVLNSPRSDECRPRNGFSQGIASQKSIALVPDLLENAKNGNVMAYKFPMASGYSSRLAYFWKLFNSKEPPGEQLFDAYLGIPPPRLRFFSQEQIYTLLSNLSRFKQGDEGAMLRYLSIIDDMKIGRVSIPRSHWNIAISLVAKSYRRLTDHDLQSGLFLWREMEKIAGVPADATTFNILFHLAANSDMPHLPLMILKEMKRRNVPMDRFSYVNLIMYYGKQGNGKGIRSTYREFLGTGEVVDIVVLNAIMTALIGAGEPQAAHDILTHIANLSCKENAALLKDKRYNSRLHKDMKELKWVLNQQGFDSTFNLHRLAPPIPDLVSFAIFIDYHASETADFGRILSLLHDLSEYGINSETSILQSLFKGFTLHGRLRYTPWTLQRLNAVFEAFINGGYPITRDAVLWCLRAYLILAGNRKANAIWDLLKAEWLQQGGCGADIMEVENRVSKMRSR